MGDKSQIEWTDATWNPLRGCSKVSAGCANCYAEGVAARFSGPGLAYEGLTTGGKWNGKIKLVLANLDQPLRWMRPRRIFVNSMSDLFHPGVPDSFIAEVFVRMLLCPEHDFQVLTKRPGRMLEWMATGKDRILEAMRAWPVRGGWRDWCEKSRVQRVRHDCWIDAFEEGRYPWPLPNVWLGVTAENQATADARIPLLLQCPAAVRWVSVEPMVGAVDLGLDAATCDCCPRWPSRWVRLHRPVCSDLPLPVSTLMAAAEGIYRAGSNRHGALGVDTPTGYLGIKPAEFECLPGLDWIVCGGESGPRARPVHPEWVRSLRDQCAVAEVPFLFKQWGEWSAEYREGSEVELATLADNQQVAGGAPDGMHTLYTRVGKRAAGRELDGVIHDAYPVI